MAATARGGRTPRAAQPDLLKPVNLGDKVNTKFDETDPFLLPDGPAKAWFVLVFVVLFVFCMQGTIGPLVWLLLSEIFPLKIRSLAIGISVLVLWLSNAVVSLGFPVVVEDLGEEGPQGDGGAEQAVAEGNAGLAQGVVGIEDCAEAERQHCSSSKADAYDSRMFQHMLFFELAIVGGAVVFGDDDGEIKQVSHRIGHNSVS